MCFIPACDKYKIVQYKLYYVKEYKRDIVVGSISLSEKAPQQTRLNKAKYGVIYYFDEVQRIGWWR